MAEINPELYVKMVYEDGILRGKYNASLTIDIDVAKAAVEYRKKLTNYKQAPILVDSRGVIEITKEARNYFSSDEGYQLLSAAAILIESKFTSYLANFFLNVNLKKTPVPIKLFTSETEALKWLENYR